MWQLPNIENTISSRHSKRKCTNWMNEFLIKSTKKIIF